MREIKLDDREYTSMILILGQCTGFAAKHKDPELMNKVLRLTNTLLRGNPDYVPYDTEEGKYL